MTHDEFFGLAIDKDGDGDPARAKEVADHRRDCADCRKLEEDHKKIVEMRRAVIANIPPASPQVREAVMEAARKAVAARKRPPAKESAPPQAVPPPAPPPQARPLILIIIVLGIVVVIGLFLARHFLASEPPREPVDHGIVGWNEDVIIKEAEATLERARATKDQGSTREALGDFNSIGERSKLWLRGRLGAAECLFILGKPAEAQAQARLVLEDPRASDADKARATAIVESSKKPGDR